MQHPFDTRELTLQPSLPSVVTAVLCSMLQMAENPDHIRWLPQARLNIAEAALCSRSESATALVWAEEAAPDQLASMTLGQLKEKCQEVAAALAAAGFAAGCNSCLTSQCDQLMHSSADRFGDKLDPVSAWQWP